MQKTPGGIAARAGRWSARHKKTAIAGWLVFVVVALMAGNLTGTKEPTDADRYDGESRAAQQIITDAGFSDAAGEMVLVQSSTLTTKDAAFRAAVKDVQRAVAAQPVVTNVSRRSRRAARSPRTATRRSSSSTSRVTPTPRPTGSPRSSPR